MNDKNRIPWIDYSKILCIWLMVCCHAGQKGLILDLTYQFHMPAFFIMSGILFRPKGFLRTVKNLGFPILVYGILNLCYRLFKDDCMCVTFVIKNWIQGFLFSSEISVFKGYWFILTIMLLRIVMESDFVRKKKLWLFIGCLLWSSIEPYLPMRLQTTLMFKPFYVILSIPFFVTGMVIKERKMDVLRGSFEMKLLNFRK